MNTTRQERIECSRCGRVTIYPTFCACHVQEARREETDGARAFSWGALVGLVFLCSEVVLIFSEWIYK